MSAVVSTADKIAVLWTASKYCPVHLHTLLPQSCGKKGLACLASATAQPLGVYAPATLQDTTHTSWVQETAHTSLGLCTAAG